MIRKAWKVDGDMPGLQFDFRYYEPWMLDQIIEIFHKEYTVDRQSFARYFDAFYNHLSYPMESIRIVALDGDTVAGFVSFTYWPYMVKGKLRRSFQCGNVIVNRYYRGKRLYNRMLEHLDSIHEKHNIDFLIGFPIKPILGIYLENNWTRLLNIQWYVKVINPFAIYSSLDIGRLRAVFSTERTIRTNLKENNLVYLANTPAFCAWRDGYKPYLIQDNIFFFYFEDGGNEIEFDLKVNKRKYGHELVIGDVKTSSYDKEFFDNALRELIKAVQITGQVSILSFATNDKSKDQLLLNGLKKKRFFKIRKDILVINKQYNPAVDIDNPADWKLYRSDIDTW